MARPRIGSVPYLNARPLVEGLEDVRFAVPSRLARLFRAGEVDVALVPSFEAVRSPESVVVPGLCIASPGPVDSVFLFSREPLHSARRVLLDESSLTSAALTRVLLAERYGIDVEFERCPPDVDPRAVDADAVLLIGDRALQAPRDNLVVNDLALLWREWTGLPFVFAVWLARDEAVAAAAGPELRAAKERGLAARERIAREAAEELGLPPGLLHRYLTERLTYDLGKREREALELFGAHCRRLELA